jgi:NADPH-dependent 2,4-dienoyl-CoA reductase/sulfur reductase-like enzyme
MNSTVTSVDAQNKEASVKDNATGNEYILSYDKLVIGSGAKSVRPSAIEGLDLPGVFFLRTMGDCLAVEERLNQNIPSSVESAVIAGGGYVGLEMSEALTRRGIKVTVVELLDRILTTVD